MKREERNRKGKKKAERAIEREENRDRKKRETIITEKMAEKEM